MGVVGGEVRAPRLYVLLAGRRATLGEEQGYREPLVLAPSESATRVVVNCFALWEESVPGRIS